MQKVLNEVTTEMILGSESEVKKVWGYGRSSTDKQAASTMVQRQSVESWFENEKSQGRLEGVEWGGWFEDNAVSGKIPWFQRDAASRMLLHVRPGDIIVVAICDRAIRSNLDACRCLEDLDRFGIRAKFLDNPSLDTTTIDGRMLFQIISAMAERERKIIARRTQERYAWARENKIPINGKAPPGWRVVRGRNNIPAYAPDNRERDLCEYILRLMDGEGLSGDQVFRRLRGEGFKNKFGREHGRQWIYDAYHAAKDKFPHPSKRLEKRRQSQERRYPKNST